MIGSIVESLMRRARSKRSNIFLEYFQLTEKTKILDLGSGDGSYIASIIQNTPILAENIYIADIDENLVTKGQRDFGFKSVIISESNSLPFEDRYFDIVFCSSVIEHVTVPKANVWELLSGRQFGRLASQSQRKFAAEIARLGKGYFVQTPNKWFPIESHTWLPFVSYLPRRILVPLLKLSNRVWVKKTSPDWYLLSISGLRRLFPGATILTEEFFGLTKSIMAFSPVH